MMDLCAPTLDILVPELPMGLAEAFVEPPSHPNILPFPSMCFSFFSFFFFLFFFGGGTWGATEVLTAFSSSDLLPHKLLGGGSGVQE